MVESFENLDDILRDGPKGIEQVPEAGRRKKKLFFKENILEQFQLAVERSRI